MTILGSEPRAIRVLRAQDDDTPCCNEAGDALCRYDIVEASLAEPAVGIELSTVREFVTVGQILQAYDEVVYERNRFELRLAGAIGTRTTDAWPVADALRKLADAADILLNSCDYDGHGHEEIAAARDAARQHVGTPPAQRAIPIDEALGVLARFVQEARGLAERQQHIAATMMVPRNKNATVAELRDTVSSAIDAAALASTRLGV